MADEDMLNGVPVMSAAADGELECPETVEAASARVTMRKENMLGKTEGRDVAELGYECTFATSVIMLDVCAERRKSVSVDELVGTIWGRLIYTAIVGDCASIVVVHV